MEINEDKVVNGENFSPSTNQDLVSGYVEQHLRIENNLILRKFIQRLLQIWNKIN